MIMTSGSTSSCNKSYILRGRRLRARMGLADKYPTRR